MPRILLIEDEMNMAFGMSVNLEQEGHEIDLAYTASEGAAKALSGVHDLILLDLILPDGQGLEVLTSARTSGVVCPIIVVSAISDEVTKVAAFRLGADDYMTKPFGVLELIERVKARLREANRTTPDTVIIDTEHFEVTYRGAAVALTRREFELLLALFRSGGAVTPKRNLLQDIWKLGNGIRTRTLDYHLCNLKRKLAAAGLPDTIRVLHGKGVMLDSARRFSEKPRDS